jgi:quercetin dioxygenase-like cupin family protein
MPRPISKFVVVTVLFAISALLGRWWVPVHAQEATPAAPFAMLELAPGVTAELFGAVPSARAEGQTVYLARFVFQPGAEIFPHRHPGTTLLGVESGAFGWTLQEGTAHLVRGAGSGGTEVEDLTEPGTDVVLTPGDAISYEEDVVHTARGAGDEPTVVMGTFVLETGQPLLMPANLAMGTPTP